ncbi:MAG: hypothetical protein KDD83_28335, partial [Caldilineaceae bacterium]|nr:hypothetical protein [Caldilineaceae bacterium]
HSPHPDQQKQSIFVAQAPRMTDAAAPAGDAAAARPQSLSRDCYLLFADRQGTARALHRELTGRGARVVAVTAGEHFHREQDDRFTVDPTSKEDLVALFAALEADHLVPTTVVHAWSLDHPVVASLTDDPLSPDALVAAQTTGVFHAFALVQVLAAASFAEPARVVFLTRHSVQVTETDCPTGLTAAPLRGLVRVTRNERLAQRWIQIDLAAT